MVELDVSSLLTTAGVATAVTLLTQVILTVSAMSPEASSRWGPLIAILLGVVLAVAAAVILISPITATVLGNAVITGVIGGLTAIGFHSVAVKSELGTAVANGLGIQAKPSSSPPVQ